MDLNNNGKDDVQELKEAAGAFIHDAEKSLEDAATAGWHWLQNELAKLTDEVKTDLKAALVQAAGDDKPIGEVVADTLTILARDGMDLVEQVGSDVIEALAGLTTVKPRA